MATFKNATEYGNALQKRLTELEKAHGRVVATVHAEQMVRIFQEGERESGAKIGSYDTRRPLYVNPDTVPRKFTPMGKPSGKRKRGRTTFQGGKKEGEKHKTRYFPHYSAFRQSQRRQTNFVDLKLSGQLQSDWANSLQKQGDIWITGTRNPVNTAKLEGAIGKYGADIVRFQDDERELLTNTMREERLRIGV